MRLRPLNLKWRPLIIICNAICSPCQRRRNANNAQFVAVAAVVVVVVMVAVLVVVAAVRPALMISCRWPPETGRAVAELGHTHTHTHTQSDEACPVSSGDHHRRRRVFSWNSRRRAFIIEDRLLSAAENIRPGRGGGILCVCVNMDNNVDDYFDSRIVCVIIQLQSQSHARVTTCVACQQQSNKCLCVCV